MSSRHRWVPGTYLVNIAHTSTTHLYDKLQETCACIYIYIGSETSATPKCNYYYYYYYYLLDRSRESTVFRQILRSCIMAANSPVVVAPVSLFSWSTYVVSGRPLPRCPCVGSQRMRRCAPSSGCRWQCPASRSRLAVILSLSFGSFPYSATFVILWLQWTLRAFLSILV